VGRLRPTVVAKVMAQEVGKQLRAPQPAGQRVAMAGAGSQVAVVLLNQHGHAPRKNEVQKWGAIVKSANVKVE
jgi:hypothetical protein